MESIVKTISVKWFAVLPFYFFTFLPLTAQNALPQATAAHLCRLMVCDNEGNISPLSNYIRQQQMMTNDSLSLEQLFAVYVFDYKGWQTLRIFPHQEGNQVVWYAPDDKLPATMSQEHQKYIHEVFARMDAEVQAGNWQMVDAYIDRLVQYQCKFSATATGASPTPNILWIVAGSIGLFLLFPFVLTFYQKHALRAKA